MSNQNISAEFLSAITTCIRKFLDFNGRAARPEFWYFVIPGFLVSIIGATWGIPLISYILLIPAVTAAMRRLHDMDKSGAWLFLVIIPVLGHLAILFILAQKGTKGPNRFGEEPAANTSFGFEAGGMGSNYEPEEFNREKYEHEADDADYHQNVNDHDGNSEIRPSYIDLPEGYGKPEAKPDDEPERDRYGRLIGVKKVKRKKDDDFLEG